jgi:uncharacterized protein YhdP
VVRAFWLLYFGFVLLILALRYLVLPNIETYRPAIEQQLSRTLGLSVSIGRIAASWDGIHPDLLLSDVRIADSKGQPALALLACAQRPLVVFATAHGAAFAPAADRRADSASASR